MKNFITIVIIALCSIAACLTVVLLFKVNTKEEVYIKPVPEAVLVVDPAPDPQPDPENSAVLTPEMKADNTFDEYVKSPEHIELRDKYRNACDYYSVMPKGWIPDEKLNDTYRQSLRWMLGYYSYESGLQIQHVLQEYFVESISGVECTQIDTEYVDSIQDYVQIVYYNNKSYYVWSEGYDGYLMLVE